MTTFNHLDLWLEELKEVRLVHRHVCMEYSGVYKLSLVIASISKYCLTV